MRRKKYFQCCACLRWQRPGDPYPLPSILEEIRDKPKALICASCYHRCWKGKAEELIHKHTTHQGISTVDGQSDQLGSDDETEEEELHSKKRRRQPAELHPKKRRKQPAELSPNAIPMVVKQSPTLQS